MSKRDADILLEDIILAIDKSTRYTQGYDLKQFVSDEKTIDAVARNIEIIGEATTKLPEDLKLKHPEVDWKRIKGMRNRIVHEYFGVDIGIVWEIVSNHLPILKKRIEVILKDLNDSQV